MAQTGYTPILIYSSSTTTNAPAAGNLTNSTFGSELAINITDGKLFYKDNTNAVQVIAWKTTPTTAGGTGLTSYTAGDLPYYATGTTLSKLAIGTNGQILTSTGTAPQWTTLSGVAVTSISFGTTGLTPATATQGAVTVAGTLITTNGGTGVSSYTAGDLTYYASGTALTKLAIGASGRWLGSSGTAPQWNAPAALTKTDDTNVTLTLGGSASTALLNAASLTLGWTGTLAVSRGGTGTGTAFTAGSVVFAGASGVYTQDNSNFFWDNTNKRLGLGTNSPSSLLNVAGNVIATASADATCSLVVRNLALDLTGGNPNRAGIGFGNITSNGPNAAIVAATYGNSFFEFYLNASFTTPVAKMFASGGVSIGNTTDPGAGALRVQNDVISAAGNFVVGTSGKGIDFSATPGTGTSELLADYEEGTWTPRNGYVTLTNNVTARYTKVGRFVYATFNVTFPVNSQGNLAEILDLPFSAVSTTTGSATFTDYGSILQLQINFGTGGNIYNSAGTALTNANLSGKQIIGMYVYSV